jgi:hypothetical protein
MARIFSQKATFQKRISQGRNKDHPQTYEAHKQNPQRYDLAQFNQSYPRI